MSFLIGVLILILFIIFIYFFIKVKIRIILNKTGFRGLNIRDIVENARLENQEVPKSLASMDRIYLEQIKNDFIDININELKRKSEKVILDCYMAAENDEKSKFKGNLSGFIEKLVHDYDGELKFKNFRFHNTVVSKYEKDKGVATIYLSSNFEYCLEVDGVNKKVQDRARTEFIYVIDASKVADNQKVLGINCPNCGSPLTSLGEKKCSYCGSTILEIVPKVFICNDIVRY